MRKEKILLVDNSRSTLEALSTAVTVFGKNDGHTVAGKARSIEEVEKIIKEGEEITFALVDNRIKNAGDGKIVADLIRKNYPGAIIFSISADSNVTWGDQNWCKDDMSVEKLIQVITELQH